MNTEYLKLGAPIKPVFISANLSAHMKGFITLHVSLRVVMDINMDSGGKNFIREKDGKSHVLVYNVRSSSLSRNNDYQVYLDISWILLFHFVSTLFMSS